MGEEKFRQISVEIDGRVATIWLRRPPLNIIGIEMMGELLEALRLLEKRGDLRVLVLRSGVDGVFSAGADVKEHLPERAEELINRFEELILGMINFPRPSISVVDGRCLGGGMELALACDFVLVSDRSVLGQPEVRVGVYPPAAAALYPRIVGTRRALEVLMTGREISGEEAARMGLVTRAVSRDALDNHLRELIDTLSMSSGVVLGYAKRAVYETLHLPLQDAFRRSSRIYLEELMKSEDSVEGLTAFIEKRKPQWRHR